MIRIRTLSISHARALTGKQLRLLNITVGTGNPAFAPTWDMVRSIHDTRAHINDQTPEAKQAIERYKKAYSALMEQSKVSYQDEWESLLASPEIVLMCYCTGQGFCHRFILADILVDWLSERHPDLVYYDSGYRFTDNLNIN